VTDVPAHLEELTALASAAVADRGVLVGPLEWFTYATSAPLYTASLDIGSGGPVPVVVKDVTRSALLAGAAAVKPASFHDPLRELGVYRVILAGVDGPAALYGAHVETSATSVLVLERVEGLELRDVGDVDVWADTAAWFGAFHGTAGSGSADEVNLVPHDAGLRIRLRDRALAASTRLGDRQRRPVIRAIEIFDGPACELLDAATRGVVHGEAYPSNVVVGGAGLDGTIDAAPRICVVDWETAGAGPLLLDAAALTTGEWPDADRARVLGAYRSAAEAGGVAFADFEAELAACRLQLAIQWLGWFMDDVPPSRQARDWAAEAVAAAEFFT
jgi:hypothetical protein